MINKIHAVMCKAHYQISTAKNEAKSFESEIQSVNALFIRNRGSKTL